MNLEKEVESIVMATWGTPEDEVARECMARFNISFEQAKELVLFAIQEEVAREEYYEPSEADEWADFDPYC